MTIREFFSFPHPVNDYAARMVAAMVACLALAVIFLDARWLLWVLTYEFLARVLAGPKISVMARLALQVIVPALRNISKPTPGPPKRFAQAIGLGFSSAALVLDYGFGLATAANALLGVLVLFASLEAGLGFCAGCFVFRYLMLWGLVPKSVCEDCLNWQPSKLRS
jgi:hypothetical protein